MHMVSLCSAGQDGSINMHNHLFRSQLDLKVTEFLILSWPSSFNKYMFRWVLKRELWRSEVNSWANVSKLETMALSRHQKSARIFPRCSSIRGRTAPAQNGVQPTTTTTHIRQTPEKAAHEQELWFLANEREARRGRFSTKLFKIQIWIWATNCDDDLRSLYLQSYASMPACFLHRYPSKQR